MNQLSKWAGYLASVFIIAFFILAYRFMVTPPWAEAVLDALTILAFGSAFICLLAGFISFLKNRK